MTNAAASSLPAFARIDDRVPVASPLRGAIVAMGNFDGFHRGHQAVVARAVEWARAEGRPAIVATFDPHPVRLFQPDAEPFRLTTLDQRARLFAAAGAQAMLVFRFDRAFAARGPQEFVEYLTGPVGAAGVVTGEDFTFGKGRGGTIASLAALGASLGLRSDAVAPIRDASGEVVSSSRIRAALRAGDCALASDLLTRPFAIEGTVVHGDKFGRTLNFPTANLDLDDYARPAYGIYAVRGLLPGGQWVDGAANLGIRPMIDPPKELLEPHFFDYSGDLYGRSIEVHFVRRLRGEEKFPTFEALKEQIAADCVAARQILAATPRLP